ncbi:MAG: hypothetical protein EOP24_34365 [Hyphomicrobiales bacterium]|nr:MAG: hypothetical protein EOP24_34365 [Hyphomicrobiales bacterium]
MGKAARAKSRNREDILANEDRCIYCLNPPETVEHMPPRSAFRAKQRPSGMEFACCGECNRVTSHSDVVAAYFARLGAHEKPGDWQFDESLYYERMLRQRVPGVLEEIYDREGENVYVYNKAGVMEPMKRVHGDGPILRAHLTVFGAKLGMAYFREHMGKPLTVEGGVSTLFFLNGGMSETFLNTILADMPQYGNLHQGKFTSQGQFDYRYAAAQDGLVALTRLQTGMHFLTFAMEKVDAAPPLEGSEFVRPGELYARVPQAIRRPRLLA